MVTQGCHVNASITHSPRKPKTRPSYEVVADREDRDDEEDAKAAMRVIEVIQPGVDTEARWVKKGGKSVFGYKQHTLVKNRLLTQRQSQRNSLISKARYVVERTFGSQARWFGAKVLRYRGKAKAHAWHILQAMAYNLKRLPRLYVSRQVQSQS